MSDDSEAKTAPEIEASRFGTDLLLANSFTLVLLSIVSSTYFQFLIAQPGIAYGSLGLLFYNSSILANFFIVVWTIFLALHTRAGWLRGLLGQGGTLTPGKMKRRIALDVGLTITGIVGTMGSLLTLVVIAGVLKNLSAPTYATDPSHVLGGFMLSILIASLYSLSMLIITSEWLPHFVKTFYLDILTAKQVKESSKLWMRGGLWIVIQVIWIVGIVGTVGIPLPPLTFVSGYLFVTFGLLSFLIPLLAYYLVRYAIIRYLNEQESLANTTEVGK